MVLSNVVVALEQATVLEVVLKLLNKTRCPPQFSSACRSRCSKNVLTSWMFEVLEVVLDDDVSDRVKDELNYNNNNYYYYYKDELYVVGVRSTCEVRVNLLCLPALVQVLELFLDVCRRFVVSVHTCTRAAETVPDDRVTGQIRPIFSERELKFMFAICHRRSVCRLSVVCRLSSVTFVRPTQTIKIFRNVSTP